MVSLQSEKTDNTSYILSLLNETEKEAWKEEKIVAAARNFPNGIATEPTYITKVTTGKAFSRTYEFKEGVIRFNNEAQKDASFCALVTYYRNNGLQRLEAKPAADAENPISLSFITIRQYQELLTRLIPGLKEINFFILLKAFDNQLEANLEDFLGYETVKIFEKTKSFPYATLSVGNLKPRSHETVQAFLNVFSTICRTFLEFSNDEARLWQYLYGVNEIALTDSNVQTESLEPILQTLNYLVTDAMVPETVKVRIGQLLLKRKLKLFGDQQQMTEQDIDTLKFYRSCIDSFLKKEQYIEQEAKKFLTTHLAQYMDKKLPLGWNVFKDEVGAFLGKIEQMSTTPPIDEKQADTEKSVIPDTKTEKTAEKSGNILPENNPAGSNEPPAVTAPFLIETENTSYVISLLSETENTEWKYESVLNTAKKTLYAISPDENQAYINNETTYLGGLNFYPLKLKNETNKEVALEILFQSGVFQYRTAYRKLIEYYRDYGLVHATHDVDSEKIYLEWITLRQYKELLLSRAPALEDVNFFWLMGLFGNKLEANLDEFLGYAVYKYEQKNASYLVLGSQKKGKLNATPERREKAPGFLEAFAEVCKIFAYPAEAIENLALEHHIWRYFLLGNEATELLSRNDFSLEVVNHVLEKMGYFAADNKAVPSTVAPKLWDLLMKLPFTFLEHPEKSELEVPPSGTVDLDVYTYVMPESENSSGTERALRNEDVTILTIYLGYVETALKTGQLTNLQLTEGKEKLESLKVLLDAKKGHNHDRVLRLLGHALALFPKKEVSSKKTQVIQPPTANDEVGKGKENNKEEPDNELMRETLSTTSGGTGGKRGSLSKESESLQDSRAGKLVLDIYHKVYFNNQNLWTKGQVVKNNTSSVLSPLLNIVGKEKTTKDYRISGFNKLVAAGTRDPNRVSLAWVTFKQFQDLIYQGTRNPFDNSPSIYERAGVPLSELLAIFGFALNADLEEFLGYSVQREPDGSGTLKERDSENQNAFLESFANVCKLCISSFSYPYSYVDVEEGVLFQLMRYFLDTTKRTGEVSLAYLPFEKRPLSFVADTFNKLQYFKQNTEFSPIIRSQLGRLLLKCELPIGEETLESLQEYADSINIYINERGRSLDTDKKATFRNYLQNQKAHLVEKNSDNQFEAVIVVLDETIQELSRINEVEIITSQVSLIASQTANNNTGAKGKEDDVLRENEDNKPSVPEIVQNNATIVQPTKQTELDAILQNKEILQEKFYKSYPELRKLEIFEALFQSNRCKTSSAWDNILESQLGVVLALSLILCDQNLLAKKEDSLSISLSKGFLSCLKKLEEEKVLLKKKQQREVIISALKIAQGVMERAESKIQSVSIQAPPLLVQKSLNSHNNDFLPTQQNTAEPTSMNHEKAVDIRPEVFPTNPSIGYFECVPSTINPLPTVQECRFEVLKTNFDKLISVLLKHLNVSTETSDSKSFNNLSTVILTLRFTDKKLSCLGGELILDDADANEKKILWQDATDRKRVRLLFIGSASLQHEKNSALQLHVTEYAKKLYEKAQRNQPAYSHASDDKGSPITIDQITNENSKDNLLLMISDCVESLKKVKALSEEKAFQIQQAFSHIAEKIGTLESEVSTLSEEKAQINTAKIIQLKELMCDCIKILSDQDIERPVTVGEIKTHKKCKEGKCRWIMHQGSPPQPQDYNNPNTIAQYVPENYRSCYIKFKHNKQSALFYYDQIEKALIPVEASRWMKNKLEILERSLSSEAVLDKQQLKIITDCTGHKRIANYYLDKIVKKVEEYAYKKEITEQKNVVSSYIAKFFSDIGLSILYHFDVTLANKRFYSVAGVGNRRTKTQMALQWEASTLKDHEPIIRKRADSWSPVLTRELELQNQTQRNSVSIDSSSNTIESSTELNNSRLSSDQ